ncbi:MAG TPA: 23S rRNA (pseudouridine(1915)-N(3))-methyltransferase RlmH [Bacteroidetes bacterium]|nr:23S rRNA (pseudouridine(1915)-N(3))-methyltransferase RlmH [Bacteroidota bacterium]
MQIELWCIGKNSFDFVDKGVQEYSSRLKHYSKFKIVYLDDVKRGKKDNPGLVKDKEGKLTLSKLTDKDILILLDEKGREMNSVKFSAFIENKMLYSSKRMIFLIGGAFGFSKELYDRADDKISLSKMTFSHQLIRVCFVEQLYRAFTIIKNEKYHNA